MCFCLWEGYAHVSAGAGRGQKGASGPLELELQEDVSHPAWVLKAGWSSLEEGHILLTTDLSL